MKKFTIILLGIFILGGVTQILHSSTGESELRKEIVKVKYINVFDAYSVLTKYISPKGKIQPMVRVNRLMIEDIPEVMDKLLSILKELDVRPVDLEFSVELILGSKTLDKKMVLDKELKSDPLIKELRSLLRYKSFKILDSSIIKVQENKYSTQRMGGEGIDLRLRLDPRYIKEEKGEIFQVELRLEEYLGLDRDDKESTLTLIKTTLALKSGERTVVGVSKLDGGDKALILILSGKVIK